MSHGVKRTDDGDDDDDDDDDDNDDDESSDPLKANVLTLEAITLLFLLEFIVQ